MTRYLVRSIVCTYCWIVRFVKLSHLSFVTCEQMKLNEQLLKREGILFCLQHKKYVGRPKWICLFVYNSAAKTQAHVILAKLAFEENRNMLIYNETLALLLLFQCVCLHKRKGKFMAQFPTTFLSHDKSHAIEKAWEHQ